MRVAWFVPSGVTPADSPLHIPALSQLAELLSESVDLTVFSFSPNGPSVRSHLRGKVHDLPVAWNDPLWKRAAVLWSSFNTIHRHHPFDMLHGFWALPCGFLAAAFGRTVQAKSVATFLGGEAADEREIRYGNLRSPRSRYVTTWTCRNATAVHLLTEFQRRALASQGLNFPNQHIIPLGVDTKQFRTEKKTLSPPYRFLHVANLTEVKGQETLLRAFRIIRNRVEAKLRIVGPDFMNGSLQAMASSFGLSDSVEFTGLVPHRSLPAHYRWAHVYLQSSRYEGQGISVLEAMASGVAVCGTQVGLLADLPFSAVVGVPKQHHEELAGAALNLLEKRKFEMMTRQGRQWAEHHSMAHTKERLLALYEELALC